MTAALGEEMKEADLVTRQDLREAVLQLKHDLTVRLGGIMAAGIGAIGILVAIF